MRIGLIGCGEIGKLRAAALSTMGTHTLVAVADVDVKKATEIATKVGAEILTDWRQLLRKDLDAVIVSTPPSHLAEMSIAASRSGKHVLCEKPLARTMQECEAMINAADEAGRILATGFNYRFYPSIKKARQLLDSGIIGELDHIRSFTGYSASDHNHDWLHDVDVMGGGTLWDNGIHLIDLTSYFLGEVIEIKGFSSDHVWGFRGCEDNGFALLKSKAGKIASLHTSWTEWRGYRLLVEIYGHKGCIRAWCFPMLTQIIWTKERGGAMQRKLHLFPKIHLMEKLRSYKWVVTQSFVDEFKEFSRAINGQATSVATGRDGLLALRIAHTASHLA